MRSLVVILKVLVLSLLVVACGGGEEALNQRQAKSTPTPSATGTPFSTPTPFPSGTPMLFGVNPTAMFSVEPATAVTRRLSGTGLEGYLNIRALANDPNSQRLYGVDYFTQELLSIDPSNRQVDVVGPLGKSAVQTLTFDPTRGVLFGVSDTSKELLSINPQTGRATSLGVIKRADLSTINSIGGLSVHPVSGVLYATDLSLPPDELITINVNTARATTVGPLTHPFVVGLSFTPNGNALYATDLNADQLISINAATGQSTAVGFLGYVDVRGISFVNNTLHGIDAASARLLSISTNNGVATELGPLGIKNVFGLAMKPSTGELFATDTFGERLLKIDPLTAQPAVLGDLKVGGTTLHDVRSLAYDAVNAILYGVDVNDAPDKLYRLNTSTGAATLVGPTNLHGMRAIAYHQASGNLYGVNLGIHGELFLLNKTTGASTLVAEIADRRIPASPKYYNDIRGLTVHPGSGGLIAAAFEDNVAPAEDRMLILTVDRTNGEARELTNLGSNLVYGIGFKNNGSVLYALTGAQLIAINTSYQVATVGSVDAFDLEGATYDANAQVLYASDVKGWQLIAIDPQTRLATVQGPFGPYPNVAGLAFDRNHQRLYGTETISDQLLRIDRATGFATVVGPLNSSNVAGLAYDPISDTLYGADADNDRLVVINTSTGQATAVGAIGSLGFAAVKGLAYDEATRTLYGVDSASYSLITIDVLTGVGTAIDFTGYELEGLGEIFPL